MGRLSSFKKQQNRYNSLKHIALMTLLVSGMTLDVYLEKIDSYEKFSLYIIPTFINNH